MDRLTGFEVFVTIVDAGGFGRAAERLGMSPAMVSTHLARLEDRLGARLIDRSTRRFALTLEGHRFLQDARAILDAVMEAESGVRGGTAHPRGQVMIDAPGAIGLRFLVPAIPALRERYPDVAIDLSFSERSMVFRPEGSDIMIRVGDPPEGRGAIVPLGATRFVQVASPAYLARKGTPASPDHLSRHDLIVYATAERPLGQKWRFRKDGRTQWLRPRAAVAFNHGDAITAAAAAGVGIAQTLEMLVAPEIAAGRLVPLLPEWNDSPVPLQLFMPQDRARRPAVRAVSRFLAEAIDWPSPGGAAVQAGVSTSSAISKT